MRSGIDDFFDAQANGRNTPVQGLEDWGLYNDPDLMLQVYQLWTGSNFQTGLPEPGDIWAQSWHVRADIMLLMRVERWHEQQKSRPSVDSLPRMDNA